MSGKPLDVPGGVLLKTHTHTIPFQPMTDQAMIYNPACVGVKAEARGSQILRGYT